MLPDMELQQEREYLLKQREAFLLLVDAIERRLAISPRTSELRREERDKLQAVRNHTKEVPSRVYGRISKTK